MYLIRLSVLEGRRHGYAIISNELSRHEENIPHVMKYSSSRSHVVWSQQDE